MQGEFVHDVFHVSPELDVGSFTHDLQLGREGRSELVVVFNGSRGGRSLEMLELFHLFGTEVGRPPDSRPVFVGLSPSDELDHVFRRVDISGEWSTLFAKVIAHIGHRAEVYRLID